MPQPFWDYAYGDLDASTMGGPSHEVIVLGEALLASGFGPRRVIDLGSGEGRNSLFLAGLGHHLTAIDISERAVEKLRTLSLGNSLDIIVEKAEIENFDLGVKYDLVLAHGSLHFISREKLLPLICRLQDATCDGGAHVVTLALFDDEPIIPEFANAGHRNPLAKGELISLYASWEVVVFESYRKWDAHPGLGEHSHPIEKWIFLKPGGTRIPIFSTPIQELPDEGAASELHAKFSEVKVGSLDSEAAHILGPPDRTYTYKASGIQFSREHVSTDGYKLTLTRHKNYIIYCADNIVVGKAKHYRAFHDLGVRPVFSEDL